jgi:ubiquinone biosynthesis protein
MPITRIGRGYRHLKRFRQILAVALKYGFGHILNRMKLSTYLLRGRKLEWLRLQKVVELSPPQRMRLALEQLGPTFIKLGQVLSMRPFLIPPDYVAELTKLQDEVSAISFESINGVIQEELGRSARELFSSIDRKPLASASLAQVHQARTIDGQEVIVKVQRPGVREVIVEDMSILHDLAELLSKHVPESRRYDPVGIVKELERTTRREVDFTNEARNMEIFARNFAGDETVHVPKVFWKLSSSKVLTTELVQGLKVSELTALDERGLDRQVIAQNGGRALLKQIFEDGFFHADPHPGNIFVLEGNVIAPVDFGMMGRLSPQMMTQLAQMVMAIIQRDVDELGRLYLQLGIIGEEIDLAAFKLDMIEMVDKYTGVPLKRIDMRGVVNDVFQVSQRHKVRMRSQFMLLARALSTYEEVGRKLDPEYNFLVEAEPFVRRVLRKPYEPQSILRELLKIGRDLHRLLALLPRDLESILQKVRQGQLALEFRHKGLEKMITELDRSSNRISFSLIIAALIVGSSLIMRLEVGPSLFGYSILGIAGFLIAGLLGLWLVIAILRSGRL